jgi:hypothetical protein
MVSNPKGISSFTTHRFSVLIATCLQKYAARRIALTFPCLINNFYCPGIFYLLMTTNELHNELVQSYSEGTWRKFYWTGSQLYCFYPTAVPIWRHLGFRATINTLFKAKVRTVPWSGTPFVLPNEFSTQSSSSFTCRPVSTSLQSDIPTTMWGTVFIGRDSICYTCARSWLIY